MKTWLSKLARQLYLGAVGEKPPPWVEGDSARPAQPEQPERRYVPLRAVARMNKVESQGRESLTIQLRANEAGLFATISWLGGERAGCKLFVDGLETRLGSLREGGSRLVVSVPMDGCDTVVIAELPNGEGDSIRVTIGRAVYANEPMRITATHAAQGSMAVCVPMGWVGDVRYAAGVHPLRRLPITPE